MWASRIKSETKGKTLEVEYRSLFIIGCTWNFKIGEQSYPKRKLIADFNEQGTVMKHTQLPLSISNGAAIFHDFLNSNVQFLNN